MSEPVEWRAAWEDAIIERELGRRREARELGELDRLRYQAQRAIDEAKFGSSQTTFLHWLTRYTESAAGGVWAAAETIAEDMNWSLRWVREQFERACARKRLVKQLQSRGGAHRTSVYRFNLGPWRIDERADRNAQHNWAAIGRELLRKALAYRDNVFRLHKSTGECDCWRYAPAYLKVPSEQVEIDWLPAP